MDCFLSFQGQSFSLFLNRVKARVNVESVGHILVLNSRYILIVVGKYVLILSWKLDRLLTGLELQEGANTDDPVRYLGFQDHLGKFLDQTDSVLLYP